MCIHASIILRSDKIFSLQCPMILIISSQVFPSDWMEESRAATLGFPDTSLIVSFLAALSVFIKGLLCGGAQSIIVTKHGCQTFLFLWGLFYHPVYSCFIWFWFVLITQRCAQISNSPQGVFLVEVWNLRKTSFKPHRDEFKGIKLVQTATVLLPVAPDCRVRLQM